MSRFRVDSFFPLYAWWHHEQKNGIENEAVETSYQLEKARAQGHPGHEDTRTQGRKGTRAQGDKGTGTGEDRCQEFTAYEGRRRD